MFLMDDDYVDQYRTLKLKAELPPGLGMLPWDGLTEKQKEIWREEAGSWLHLHVHKSNSTRTSERAFILAQMDVLLSRLKEIDQ